MDLFHGLTLALDAVFGWAFLAAFLIGCVNGIVFGMIPGLSGSVGIALMIPFTYAMGPAEAMALFVAALSGQSFAGSITAILINVPGSSPSAATTIDGFPLARKGLGGFAIGISAAASFLGSVIGTLVLIALFPVVRGIILAFSFPEFAMLGVMGLAVIALASRGSLLKGLISGLFGLLISFIGFAPIGGDVRYVFGQPGLFGGLDVVIVLVGMFAVAEGLRLIKGNQTVAQNTALLQFGRGQIWDGVVYTVKQPGLLMRSSLVGTGIGIVPAVGGTVASFLAYFQAAKTVKNPEFGRGDPRGVLAPEASNDAKDSGAALPTLAFGIPGSADWAIILGAMVIHGITPGPNLMRQNPDIVWVAIIVLIAASAVASLSGLLIGPHLVQVTRVRPSILAPIILCLAVVGAYALNLNMLDVAVTLAVGLLAYAMRAIGMPIIPLILGLILGPMVERSYLQTLSTFGGLEGFVTRPISLGLLVVTVAVIGWEIVSSRRAARRAPEAVAEGVRSAVRPASLALVAGFGVVSLGAFLMARDFSEQGRQFPLMTAAVLMGLVAFYLLVAVVPPLRSRLGGIIADGGGMEDMGSQLQQEAQELIEEVEGDAPAPSRDVGAPGPAPAAATSDPQPVAPVATRPDPQEPAVVVDAGSGSARLAWSMLLTVALGVGAYLVGLAVTIPVVLLLFFRAVAKESWRLSLSVTVGTCAVLWLAFVTLLGMPVTGGLLLDL